MCFVCFNETKVLGKTVGESFQVLPGAGDWKSIITKSQHWGWRVGVGGLRVDFRRKGGNAGGEGIKKESHCFLGTSDLFKEAI